MARAKVLVAYASKHGSTQEVAAAVASTLRDHGLDVELREAGEVDDVTGYDAVVVGGSLYVGRWHSHARRFLERHHETLHTLPVAVFAMGPQDLSAANVAGSRESLDRALSQVDDVEPTTVAIFGGVIDPAKLSFPFNRMQPLDLRDWDAIRSWTDDFGAAVEGMRSIEA